MDPNVSYSLTCMLMKQIIEGVGKLKENERLLSAEIFQLGKLEKILNSKLGELAEYSLVLNNCNTLRSQIFHEVDLLFDQVMDLVKKMEQKQSYVDGLIFWIIHSELPKWKKEQQLASEWHNPNNKSRLDVLQVWCEILFEIVWSTFTDINEVSDVVKFISQSTSMSKFQKILESLRNLHEKSVEMLSTLITQTFVVERQPPRVIKMMMKFTVKVRHLTGFPLTRCIRSPEVKAIIINEDQADFLKENEIFNYNKSSEMANNIATMEYDENSKQFFVLFKNLQLRNIKRTKKKSFMSSLVVEEKFALHFTVSITIGEINHQIRTFSLPVIVIEHSHQESQAWAVITWDNAFSQPDHMPNFVIPATVPWNKLAKALTMKFAVDTGKMLSEDSLKCLAERIFGKRCDDYDSMCVSWPQFNGPLVVPGNKSFTFWEWFYAALKLAQEHLREMWIDGVIFGFMNRQQIKMTLEKYPVGTFLLRFSDTVLGSITIAFVHIKDDKKTITMMKPFTGKEIKIFKFSSCLRHLKDLKILYPDIPKDEAFGKYYEFKPHKSPSQSTKKHVTLECKLSIHF